MYHCCTPYTLQTDNSTTKEYKTCVNTPTHDKVECKCGADIKMLSRTVVYEAKASLGGYDDAESVWHTTACKDRTCGFYNQGTCNLPLV